MIGSAGYHFDPLKFIYIGAANKENSRVCVRKKAASRRRQVATSPTCQDRRALYRKLFVDNMDRLMKDVLAFHADHRLQGYGRCPHRDGQRELAGGPPSWDNVKTNRKRALEMGEMIVVVQCTAKPLKELPNVPKMIDFAKTDDQKKLVIQIAAHSREMTIETVCRTAWCAERARRHLRMAFQETMKTASSSLRSTKCR